MRAIIVLLALFSSTLQAEVDETELLVNDLRKGMTCEYETINGKIH